MHSTVLGAGPLAGLSLVTALLGWQPSDAAAGGAPQSAAPAAATAERQSLQAADPTGRADTEMKRVLVALKKLGAKPVSQLTVEQARHQPSFADAVKEVVREETGKPFVPQPMAVVRDITVAGAAGPLHARLYDPKTRHGAAPLIVYYHGGGWVIADSTTYDASTRALADGTGAIVVSVDYRRGPEHRFPAAHNDAIAAYRWALQNAKRLGADPKRIALAGESAGGNLVVDTAIAARNKGLPLPVHVLSIFPVAGTNTHTPSYIENRNAKPLSRADVLWFVKYYTKSKADLMDPRLDIVGHADLHGLPPTTIISAQLDPLRSEGGYLAGRLRRADVPVERRVYRGVTHEFFGMRAVVPQARAAEEFAFERLNAAFETTSATQRPAATAAAQ